MYIDITVIDKYSINKTEQLHPIGEAARFYYVIVSISVAE